MNYARVAVLILLTLIGLCVLGAASVSAQSNTSAGADSVSTAATIEPQFTLGRTKTKSFGTPGATRTFDFSSLPDAKSDVTVSVTFAGDYADADEYAVVDADGDTIGSVADLKIGEGDCVTATQSLTTSKSKVSDGSLSVEVQNTPMVQPTPCDTNEITVGITYSANAAPTAGAGGPYFVDEGGSITLDGSGSSDPDGDSLTYQWDLDGDGLFEAAGTTPIFDASGIDGTTDLPVSLTVTDSDGASDTDSTTVNVRNVPPSVSADDGTVTVDEGETATNSGVYSDPVDPVTVTANPGTITDDSGGTWTWEYATGDDDDSTTVFVNAYDGEDTTTTSFNLNVNNVAPNLTVDNDPVVVDEGETATNTGTYSDPADSVSLSASQGTVTKTGGGNWEWNYDSSDDGDTGPVTITATDDKTSTSKTFQLNVSNVAPTIDSISLPNLADKGESVSLGASFSDPSTDDTHNATVDWDDGETTTLPESEVDQENDTLSATHAYEDNGSYTVTVTVSDDGGASDTNSTTVTVVAGPDCSAVGYEGKGTTTDPFEVTNVSQLQCMGSAGTDTSLTDNFTQTGDIDATGTAGWNAGAGFEPIGNTSVPFDGTFDGNGFTVSNLNIERPDENFGGMFGVVGTAGTVESVTLENADITSRSYFGPLAGKNLGTVTGSSASGVVVGNNMAGGLVGRNEGTISESSADTEVNADNNLVGGSVGRNLGTVTDSSAGGDVGVVPYRDNPHTATTIPHKLTQYMAFGLPVLVSDVAPLERVIEETAGGAVFPAGDPRGFATAAIELATNPEETRRLGANAGHAVSTTYNWETAGDALEATYEDLEAEFGFEPSDAQESADAAGGRRSVSDDGGGRGEHRDDGEGRDENQDDGHRDDEDGDDPLRTQ